MSILCSFYEVCNVVIGFLIEEIYIKRNFKKLLYFINIVNKRGII